MESRLVKYATVDNQMKEMTTRSSRNSRLYREVYGKYGDLDNLPIEDNTNEIDMDKLKEIVHSGDKKEEIPEHKDLAILEQRKRKIDEQKVYDINKILEKAKYENSKLKEPVVSTSNVNKNILSTLEHVDMVEDVKKDEEVEITKTREMRSLNSKENDLSMTRELRYQNLSKSTNENNLESASDLSLELFSDLKPTGDTIVTEPIHEKSADIHSGDTSDIDIIKPPTKAESDFFTSSYEFSKKDFTSDDDFFEEPKSGGIFKIILLILAILVFMGVIVYFVWIYGIGV